MKDLPVGVSRNGGTKKGYRLHRSVAGKNYLFSSFQNLDHALRVNECIDVIVADLREALDKEGTFSVDDIQKLIVENSLSDMVEITRLANKLYEKTQYEIRSSKFEIKSLKIEIERLGKQLNMMVPVIQLENKKSFWQWITGR